MVIISNYNPEVELSVLCHCLLRGDYVDQAIKSLQVGDFSLVSYQKIFQIIKKIHRTNPPEDGYIVAVGEELEGKDSGLMPVVGKIIVGSIIYGIHSQGDMTRCLEIIKGHSQRKNLHRQALNIASMLENPLIEEEELNEAISEFQPIKTKETEEERLKFEISNFLIETDPFKKIKLKNKIHCNYGINRHDFLYLVRAMKSAQSKPKKQFLTGEEFFNLDFSSQRFLIPGLLPLGDLILFAGDAKCGKSNLVGDMTRALLEGSKFLGENTTKARILYGACDETLRDTQDRFYEIGIDLIPDFKENLALLRSIEIDNLQPLRNRIEEFKPQLVIIDNLTTIARNAGIAEKDPEFAHYLYQLRDIAEQYKCTIVVLHHQNKDPLARGMKKIGGNARLLAAPSEIWQIARQDENDLKNSKRIFSLVSRNNTPRQLLIEFNSQSLWSRQGIFRLHHEIGDESGEGKTSGARILEILQTGDYEAVELKELTGLSRSIYQNLDRLLKRGEIKKRRSKTNVRSWVYFLADSQQEGDNSQVKRTSTNCTSFLPPSPPPYSLGLEEENVKKTDTKAKTSRSHHDHTLTKSDHNSPNCDQLLNGVLNGSNNRVNSISGDVITNRKKKGGEGVTNSTNKLTSEYHSQLDFLAKRQFNPGEKVTVRNPNVVACGWIGYIEQCDEKDALVVWENRQKPMLVEVGILERL